MSVLGIDLGTAHVRAALVFEGAPLLLQFGDGSHALPAVVAFHKGAVLVGRNALSRAAMQPEKTVRGVKRLLGRSIGEPIVTAIAQYASFRIEEDRESGGIALHVGDARYDPEDIAAALFRQLCDTAEEMRGTRPDTAVLTTPYWLGPRQRKALTESARRAGLKAPQIMSEGTAIALSLAATESSLQRIAIVDVGAGGLTVSLLEVSASRVTLVASTGDPLGGGDDIDRGLLRAILKGLRARFGDFPDQPAIHEMLRQTCEGMKRDLASMARATAIIPFLPVGPTGAHMQEVAVDRERFDLLIADTLARVQSACGAILQMTGFEPSDISRVYATGGLSNVQAVRATIERVLGTITSRKLDPDGAVAIGAALQAGMLSGAVASIPVIDVQSATIAPGPLGPSIPPIDVRSMHPPERITLGAPTRSMTPIHSMPPSRSSTPPVSRERSSTPPASQRRSSTPAGPSSSGVRASAFRSELAGLLAAVRAGALTEIGLQTQQVVIRANETIEEDDALGPEQRSAIAYRLQAIWKHLALTMQAARQYRWDHPQTARHLEAALAEIYEAHREAPRSVRFDVGSAYFAHHKTAVWRPDKPPFDRVPHQLFADGLRKVQFKPGLRIDELRDFITVLMSAASGFSADDDTVTALWERKFTKIAHVAVDAFVESDDPAFEGRRDELAAELAKTCNVEGDLDISLGTFVSEQREEAARAAALALPERVRQDLAAGAALGVEAFTERYANAFPEAYAEAERHGDLDLIFAALDALGAEHFASGTLTTAFDLLKRLGSALAGRPDRKEIERRLGAAMLPAERVRAILDHAVEKSDAAELAGLQLALELSGDASLFTPALGAYWKGSAALKEALLPYLLRSGHTHETELGVLLREGDVSHALAALRILAELGTVHAKEAIQGAFACPHIEVRIAAITYLPDASAEIVRAELTRLFEDPAPEVRVHALGIVNKLGAVAAGPVLVRRIQSGALTSLPPAERRLLLQTLALLNPRRAEAIAIEILDKTQMIPSPALEQTRAFAAEVLGTMHSEDAVRALNDAAKKRWWNTQLVRDAAELALRGPGSRRGTPVPKRDE